MASKKLSEIIDKATRLGYKVKFESFALQLSTEITDKDHPEVSNRQLLPYDRLTDARLINQIQWQLANLKNE